MCMFSHSCYGSAFLGEHNGPCGHVRDWVRRVSSGLITARMQAGKGTMKRCPDADVHKIRCQFKTSQRERTFSKEPESLCVQSCLRNGYAFHSQTWKTSSQFQSFIQMSLHFTSSGESLSQFSFGLQENLSEKWLFTEIASIQFVSQTVGQFLDLFRLLLTSTMLTAKRNQKFNASSAETFHRKLRAETLSTLPILQPSLSPQIIFEQLKHILSCPHSQNTNLTALKRGSSATITTENYQKCLVPCKRSTEASWNTALLPASQEGQLVCFYNKR